MSQASIALPRRAILAGGLLLPFLGAAALAAPRALTFQVIRNGTTIGEHRISFVTDGDRLTATTDAVMTVKLGPVPVFKYHHHAVETRIGGVFANLATTTTTNGKVEKVSAEKAPAGVTIACPSGKLVAPAQANPMTHWNAAIFGGPPLFNPQTGKLLKVRTTRAGNHVTIRGEAEIDNWYDETGAWQALKGKLDDGSLVEYRRV